MRVGTRLGSVRYGWSNLLGRLDRGQAVVPGGGRDGGREHPMEAPRAGYVVAARSAAALAASRTHRHTGGEQRLSRACLVTAPVERPTPSTHRPRRVDYMEHRPAIRYGYTDHDLRWWMLEVAPTRVRTGNPCLARF